GSLRYGARGKARLPASWSYRNTRSAYPGPMLTAFAIPQGVWPWVPAFEGVKETRSSVSRIHVGARKRTSSRNARSAYPGPMLTILAILHRPWLWVPAFAGTTTLCIRIQRREARNHG